MNRVSIWGTLIKPPEQRQTPDNVPLCCLVVVDQSNRYRRNFFKVIVRGDLARACLQNLEVEDFLFVEGSLQQYVLDRPHGKEHRFEILSNVVYKIDPLEVLPPAEDAILVFDEEDT